MVTLANVRIVMAEWLMDSDCYVNERKQKNLLQVHHPLPPYCTLPCRVPWPKRWDAKWCRDIKVLSAGKSLEAFSGDDQCLIACYAAQYEG